MNPDPIWIVALAVTATALYALIWIRQWRKVVAKTKKLKTLVDEVRKRNEKHKRDQ